MRVVAGDTRRLGRVNAFQAAISPPVPALSGGALFNGLWSIGSLYPPTNREGRCLRNS